jgi:hypothetical protein
LALLGSIGWGAWGVWLTLAAASLLAVAGLLAWQVDWSRPEEKPPARVSADARKPPGDTTVAAIDESVPIGGRAADGPSITIRVGQSLRLSVLGQLENGREIALAADRLSWSTQPLADYVDFDPRSMTLTGLKATPQPVVLTVYFDGVAARVRVRVIHGESGTEERQNG